MCVYIIKMNNEKTTTTIYLHCYLDPEYQGKIMFPNVRLIVGLHA